MKTLISFRLAGLAMGVVLAVCAVGSAAQAQTKVVVRTDFKFNGYISPLASIALGLVAGAICALAVSIKSRVKVDDTLWVADPNAPLAVPHG